VVSFVPWLLYPVDICINGFVAQNSSLTHGNARQRLQAAILNRKLFSHHLDLSMVNDHILQNNKNRKNILLEQFNKIIAEGPLSNAGQEIHKQSQSIRAGRLIGIDHLPYRIPST
jgi:hypothetical protein